MNDSEKNGFSLFLSIEGVFSGKMELVVPGAQMPVGELVDMIVQQYFLPLRDNEGCQIQYLLYHDPAGDGNLEVLDLVDGNGHVMCLGDYAVKEKAHLTLRAKNVQKGCPPDDVPQNGATPGKASVIAHNATGRSGGKGSVFDRSTTAHNIRHLLPERTSFLKRMVRKAAGVFSKTEEVNTTVFAPSEAERGETMTVQVMLYRDSQYDVVKKRAKMVDPYAEEKNNQVIGVPLHEGDVLSAHLSFFCPNTDAGYIVIEENDKHVTWNSNVEDITFSVFVDSRFERKLLNGSVVLKLKEIPILEMTFNVRIVNEKKKLAALAEVCSEKLSRVFISYSHADVERVKYISETCRAVKCEYFFDRHSLSPGDRYPAKIYSYIDNANLFILCWSEHAAASEWVERERKRAMEILNSNDHELRIYPISIPPKAELPADMRDMLCFGELS